MTEQAHIPIPDLNLPRSVSPRAYVSLSGTSEATRKLSSPALSDFAWTDIKSWMPTKVPSKRVPSGSRSRSGAALTTSKYHLSPRNGHRHSALLEPFGSQETYHVPGFGQTQDLAFQSLATTTVLGTTAASFPPNFPFNPYTTASISQDPEIARLASMYQTNTSVGSHHRTVRANFSPSGSVSAAVDLVAKRSERHRAQTRHYASKKIFVTEDGPLVLGTVQDWEILLEENRKQLMRKAQQVQDLIKLPPIAQPSPPASGAYRARRRNIQPSMGGDPNQSVPQEPGGHWAAPRSPDAPQTPASVVHSYMVPWESDNSSPVIFTVNRGARAGSTTESQDLRPVPNPFEVAPLRLSSKPDTFVNAPVRGHLRVSSSRGSSSGRSGSPVTLSGSHGHQLKHVKLRAATSATSSQEAVFIWADGSTNKGVRMDSPRSSRSSLSGSRGDLGSRGKPPPKPIPMASTMARPPSVGLRAQLDSVPGLRPRSLSGSTYDSLALPRSSSIKRTSATPPDLAKQREKVRFGDGSSPPLTPAVSVTEPEPIGNIFEPVEDSAESEPEPKVEDEDGDIWKIHVTLRQSAAGESVLPEKAATEPPYLEPIPEASQLPPEASNQVLQEAAQNLASEVALQLASEAAEQSRQPSLEAEVSIGEVAVPQIVDPKGALGLVTPIFGRSPSASFAGGLDGGSLLGESGSENSSEVSMLERTPLQAVPSNERLPHVDGHSFPQLPLGSHPTGSGTAGVRLAPLQGEHSRCSTPDLMLRQDLSRSGSHVGSSIADDEMPRRQLLPPISDPRFSSDPLPFPLTASDPMISTNEITPATELPAPMADLTNVESAGLTRTESMPGHQAAVVTSGIGYTVVTSAIDDWLQNNEDDLESKTAAKLEAMRVSLADETSAAKAKEAKRASKALQSLPGSWYGSESESDVTTAAHRPVAASLAAAKVARQADAHLAAASGDAGHSPVPSPLQPHSRPIPGHGREHGSTSTHGSPPSPATVAQDGNYTKTMVETKHGRANAQDIWAHI